MDEYYDEVPSINHSKSPSVMYKVSYQNSPKTGNSSDQSIYIKADYILEDNSPNSRKSEQETMEQTLYMPSDFSRGVMLA